MEAKMQGNGPHQPCYGLPCTPNRLATTCNTAASGTRSGANPPEEGRVRRRAVVVRHLLCHPRAAHLESEAVCTHMYARLVGQAASSPSGLACFAQDTCARVPPRSARAGSVASPSTHLAVADDHVLRRAEAEGVVAAQRRVATLVKQAHILAGGREGGLGW